jgi:hypothetical protein
LRKFGTGYVWTPEGKKPAKVAPAGFRFDVGNCRHYRRQCSRFQTSRISLLSTGAGATGITAMLPDQLAGVVPWCVVQDCHSACNFERRLTNQWEVVADALREKQPKLGALMDASRDDVLAYMSFPREHWPQIASTNPLERVNREVKRRSDVIGIFPNDEAIVRLVGALMLETNDEWAVARRYMSLETLARITDNPTIRLPAVAA